MSSYNAYTGTFITKGGQPRTMTFIRSNDLPSTMVESKQQPNQSQTGQEIVYDVKAKGFRTFNWNTAKGTVSKTTIQHSF
jgi:hypothetical protein